MTPAADKLAKRVQNPRTRTLGNKNLTPGRLEGRAREEREGGGGSKLGRGVSKLRVKMGMGEDSTREGDLRIVFESESEDLVDVMRQLLRE